MTTKKYELIQETKSPAGMYRIRALRSFGAVKKGDVGGWVRAEDNLSHSGDAWVFGNARVADDARVSGNARVADAARVFGNAWVYGSAWVSGNAWVAGDAKVFGNAGVYGDAWVFGNARVESPDSAVWFSRVGSEHSTLTAYKTLGGISVNRGCFSGTLDEFAAAVEETHGDNQYGREYRALIEFIKLRFGVDGEEA